MSPLPRPVLELSRLLADSDEPLQIELTSNQIRFQFGNINLVLPCHRLLGLVDR